MAKHNNNFRQLLKYVGINRFRKLIRLAGADRYVKRFNTVDLLKTLFFAVIAGKDSLRQIENSMNSHNAFLNSIGMPNVHRNTISQAMANRPSELFYEHLCSLFDDLNNRCFLRQKAGAKLTALDATHISLPPNLFDWADYRKENRGIKLHIIFNADLEIPEYCSFSLGGEQELSIAREFYHRIPKDRIVVCDKAYFSFEFLQRLNRDNVKVIIPAKRNLAFRVESEVPQKNLPPGAIADQIVVFTSQIAAKYKPVVFRRIAIWNSEKKKKAVYITNLWDEDVDFIVEQYRRRWRIEFFFRWLKKNLKTTTFYGTTRNAVEIQIWVILMLTLILKFLSFLAKSGSSSSSIYYLRHMIADMLFERSDLCEVLGICSSDT